MEQIFEELKGSLEKMNQVERYEIIRPGETRIYTTDGNVYEFKTFDDGFTLFKIK